MLKLKRGEKPGEKWWEYKKGRKKGAKNRSLLTGADSHVVLHVFALYDDGLRPVERKRGMGWKIAMHFEKQGGNAPARLHLRDKCLVHPPASARQRCLIRS
jgi:hypothetical protein